MQVHDLNPGVRHNGLFWTALVPAGDVRVDLADGTASLEVDRIHLTDYGDITNALVGGGSPPAPAQIEFKVVWNCATPMPDFNNPAQRFRGSFKTGSAQMEWSARIGDLEFRSAPIQTSSSSFAELGRERNGAFY